MLKITKIPRAETSEYEYHGHKDFLKALDLFDPFVMALPCWREGVWRVVKAAREMPGALCSPQNT